MIIDIMKSIIFYDVYICNNFVRMKLSQKSQEGSHQLMFKVLNNFLQTSCRFRPTRLRHVLV